MSRIACFEASVFILALVACAPGRRNGDGNGDAGSASQGSGDDGGTCELSCSSDLRGVVDCNGNVVTTCPANEACGANLACTDPCTAASQDKSSIGCEYYSVDPDVIAQDAGGCFAAYVANTWDTPISIKVDRGGSDLPIDGYARVPSGDGQNLTYAPLTNDMLQPGQVAILFLDYHAELLSPACPSGITPAVTDVDAAVHGTGLGQAFHITTSAPVVAYDIFPYGGGNSAVTSATLLLPTSAWDTNYVAVDAYPQSTWVGGDQPFIEIVAQTDTNVTIRPTAAIVGGGGVTGTAQNVAATYHILAGQELQFTQDDELGGSPIAADQPIGVWGGESCVAIGVDQAACDSAHQEIPPVRALGHRYVAVRYRNRYAGEEETVPWRMVGAADGTTLTYEPSAPAGAPTTLSLGQVAQFNSPGQFVVQSQDADHPFYMSAHMTGWAAVAGDSPDHRGDPEFVNIIPPEQYLSSYTFFTDPTYPETNLVFTRVSHDGVFADVKLDCLGTVTGWTPIDAADTVEYTRVDLVTGNFQGVNGCDNGVHVASSAQPFGLVVWGWGTAASTSFFSQAVSYAYPAGASVKPINTIVIQ